MLTITTNKNILSATVKILTVFAIKSCFWKRHSTKAVEHTACLFPANQHCADKAKEQCTDNINIGLHTHCWKFTACIISRGEIRRAIIF